MPSGIRVECHMLDILGLFPEAFTLDSRCLSCCMHSHLLRSSLQIAYYGTNQAVPLIEHKPISYDGAKKYCHVENRIQIEIPGGRLRVFRAQQPGRQDQKTYSEEHSHSEIEST